jgi:hypothetical protein
MSNDLYWQKRLQHPKVNLTALRNATKSAKKGSDRIDCATDFCKQ